MDTIAGLFQNSAAWVDLSWSSLLLVPLFVLSFQKYSSARGRRKATARGMNYTLLMSHIGLGAWIVARYEILAFTHAGKMPAPPLLDLAVGFLNAVFSWVLARNRIPGNPRISRTTFQALALVMGLSAVMAAWQMLWPQYASAGASDVAASVAWWYRALVKTHFAFAYVRLIGRLDHFSPMYKDHSETFTLAVFSGCVLGAVDACGRLGGPLMLGLIVLLNKAEHTVSACITPENATNFLPRLSLFVGLVDVSTYMALQEAEREQANKARAAATKKLPCE